LADEDDAGEVVADAARVSKRSIALGIAILVLAIPNVFWSKVHYGTFKIQSNKRRLLCLGSFDAV